MKTRWTRRPLAHRGTQVLSTLAISWGVSACSGAEEVDGAPEYGNLNPFPGGGANPASPAAQNPANPNGGSPSNTTPQNNTGNTPPANNPSAPPTQTGSTPPPNPTPEGNPGGAPIDMGNMNSGGAMAPGAGGAGAMPPPTPPPAIPPPVTPPPVTPPPVTPPPVTPAAPDIPCPTGAIFCSGFEGAGFPAGTRFEPDYLAANALGTEVTLDTTVFHGGRQSLKMPVGHNYYRMLSVATPTTYWVRLFTRSNVGFGAAGSTHATLFMGSIVAPGGDYNADRAVEIAEQFGQILLNVKDSLFGTSGTNPNGQAGTRLQNDTWTCMEAEFNGGNGDVQVFVEGDPIIDAAGWQGAAAFKSFRFGYLRFDSPARDVWMDDVVVAPNRIGCQ
jgi:hypothetical protein